MVRALAPLRSSCREGTALPPRPAASHPLPLPPALPGPGIVLSPLLRFDGTRACAAWSGTVGGEGGWGARELREGPGACHDVEHVEREHIPCEQRESGREKDSLQVTLRVSTPTSDFFRERYKNKIRAPLFGFGRSRSLLSMTHESYHILHVHVHVRSRSLPHNAYSI